ncbi:MAG: hypothetical protein Q7R85_00435 [bacterium]|nr:hypothetical protein [bacterium]
MNGLETPAVEWSERLGTPNGVQIAQVLRHFHERPMLLAPPVDHLETTARPFLEAIGVSCSDIAALTLADIKNNPNITLTSSFADIVWKWGNLRERAEEYDDGGVSALEVINTAACMLEERLARPIFWEISHGLPHGTVLSQNIQTAMFEGLSFTLIHLVILLSIGDGDSAETLGPWCTFYLNGNIPLGVNEHDTFLFLTR